MNQSPVFAGAAAAFGVAILALVLARTTDDAGNHSVDTQPAATSALHGNHASENTHAPDHPSITASAAPLADTATDAHGATTGSVDGRPTGVADTDDDDAAAALAIDYPRHAISARNCADWMPDLIRRKTRSEADSALRREVLSRLAACAPMVDFPEAADAMNELLRSWPDHPSTHLAQARNALTRGDYAAAQASIDAAKQARGGVDIEIAREQLFLDRVRMSANERNHPDGSPLADDIARVVAAKRQLIELLPPVQQPGQYAELSTIYDHAGRHNDAVAAVQQGLQVLGSLDARRYPNAYEIEPLLLMRLGVGYYRSGQVETGIAYMNQAISREDDPGNIAVLENLRDAVINGSG